MKYHVNIKKQAFRFKSPFAAEEIFIPDLYRRASGGMENDMYNIAEKFVSINGEGRKAGQLSAFIRFSGCNLDCSYCDTKWANSPECDTTRMTADEILEWVLCANVNNVTITGGEPLIQNGIYQLIELLCRHELSVEVETNGSERIAEYKDMKNRPSFTVDYKLPSSGMETFMCMKNYYFLEPGDAVKFVCGTHEDLKKALLVISRYKLTEKCAVYLSPVFGRIKPAEIVDFMLSHKMNGVNLQLQLHKFIWDPDKRGV